MFRIKNILLPALIGCCLLCGCSDNQGKKNYAENKGLAKISDIKPAEINETNFPDDIFRRYVSEIFDLDSDGILSGSEIEKVDGIECREKNIQNLKGIEYFLNLEYLDCSHNHLSELDISKNVVLSDLNCSDNELTKLNTSSNILLEKLRCFSNKLIDLDVSNNTKLTYLDIHSNNLIKIDISKNVELTYLNCQHNELTEVDISSCAGLIKAKLYGQYHDGYDDVSYEYTMDDDKLSIYCDDSVLLIGDITDKKEEQNNETAGQSENDTSENSLSKDVELPYCVYGSPIAEYNGVMYGHPFENYPNLEGKYVYVCNIAFYGDKVYYSHRSAGTSEISSALYSCNMDGSDIKLLDDCEFDYDRQGYDCSEFVICDGIIYYDSGKRYINLENGEQGSIESDTLDKKLYETGKWRYHNPTKTWYYLNYDNQYIVKIVDGVEEIVYYQMRGERLDALDAITEDALYFESEWSEADKKYLQGMSASITDEDRQHKGYLWKMDLETGKLTEIDTRFIAGGGNVYYGH